MSTQPEALRLADALETADANISLMDDALWVKISPSTLDEAAAELRRLHEVNQEWERVCDQHLRHIKKLKKLITKATGEQS